MRKKLLSFVLTAAMVMSCVWSGAMPASAESDTGDFTVTGDSSGYSYSSNILVITDSGEYTVKMYTAGTTTSDTIKITGGATVTLENVSIENYNRSPLEVNSAKNVTIKLKGDNTVTAKGYYNAGLQKTSTDNTLTITSAAGDGSTDGTLTATGGENGAGIGGGSGGSGSNITINGGTVTATCYSDGAGIGGGRYGGDGSNITINGGTVTATSYNGAGIGGGSYDGDGSNITINGGTVTAAGSNGAGIGGGYTGDGTYITINGGTVKATSGEYAHAIGSGSRGTYRYIYINARSQKICARYASSDDYTVYTEKTAIEGYTSSLDNVTYFESYVYPTGDFVITGGTGYDYSSNILDITGGGEYTVKMKSGVTTTTSDTIKVTSSDAVTITLDGVGISSSKRSPFEITGSGDVTVKLKGDNTLISTAKNCAGLQKTTTDNKLIIKASDATGALTASGGDYSAGIGSGYNSSGSNITIESGTVTATGGIGGAGIGGGIYGTSSNITISGGTVTATGGSDSAGIGGGFFGSGSNIMISGGTVTATGGYGGAGIGGGHGGSGSNITISGGTVTATGGEYGGAGIGGGYDGNGSNITISGGIVTATGCESGGAGIGGGVGYSGESYGNGSNIAITGGTVTAIGGTDAAGIGKGRYSSSSSGIYIDANGKKILARYASDGSYTAYTDKTEITSLAAASTYFDSYERPTGDFVVTGDQNGYSYSDNILTFTGGGEYTVSMASGVTTSATDTIKVASSEDVTITLDGVSIENSSCSPFEITDSGNVTVKLKGDNTLTSTSKNYAGLQKNLTDNTLTITSVSGDNSVEGTLTATGGDYAAGIGSSLDSDGSNITIAGGTVTAVGGYYGGAGIGGGQGGNGSNITITDGAVTATGVLGSGIGGGFTGFGGSKGNGSNITISGGTVTATSSGAAGIGGGIYGSGSNIIISGGTVTATGGDYSAGIGGSSGGSTGSKGNGSNIIISGGTVTATGGEYGTGIGGGYVGSSSGIYIAPAEDKSISARYNKKDGYYTIYSTKTDITTSVAESYYFDSAELETPGKWTTGSDAGYYAETADATDKEGVVRFLAKYDFANYIVADNVKSCGIWFMTSDTDTDFDSGEKLSTDTDVFANPRIYADVTDIDDENATCYAKAYIVYDLDGDGTYEYMYSDLITQKVDFTGKWLGAKTTYDVGGDDVEE